MVEQEESQINSNQKEEDEQLDTPECTTVQLQSSYNHHLCILFIVSFPPAARRKLIQQNSKISVLFFRHFW